MGAFRVVSSTAVVNSELLREHISLHRHSSMLATISDAESDRRLRPVTDALRQQNLKQAVKLVQQALQKRPGWPAARALHACILLQQHRWEQAYNEITDVRNGMEAGAVPATEDAAKKIFIYYQEIQREDLAAEIYELVWKKSNPADLHLAETAFSLYIRGGAFSSAQKLATKLHRIASSQTQRYVFWATAALWLGVTYHSRSLPPALPPLSPPNTSGRINNLSINNINNNAIINQQMDDRMLKLGCAMMKKALTNSSVAPTAEMVRFATRVFKQAGEYDAAIHLISNPRLVMDETEVLHLRADVMFASSKDVSDYRNLLMNYSPNDWVYWLRFFDSLREKQPDNWLEDAQDLVNTVLEKDLEEDDVRKKKEPSRGVRLAHMELLYCREDWEGICDSIVQYFDLFGSKAVVSRDLRPWVTLLQHRKDMSNLLFGQLDAICDERGFPYHLHLCWLKLWFDRLDDSSEDLVDRYADQRLSGLEPTDRQPGDDYIILAAHKILPMVTKPGKPPTVPLFAEGHGESYDDDRFNDASAVLKTIMLLEAALIWSPCNYDFKLLLLRLYEALGGVDKMAIIWDSLDVKHVQLSTLTHLVLKSYFECGHHQPLHILIDNIEALWREINVEIPDCISRALQDGSLNAAVDFMLFKLRLERSIILAEAMVTEAHVDVLITGCEPLGVRRALKTLSFQPKFSLHSLDGSKRMVSNDDVTCYRFWDFGNYNEKSRFESLHDDLLEEGNICDPERLSTLHINLASLSALLQLTERNGNDGALPSSPSGPKPPKGQQTGTSSIGMDKTPELTDILTDEVIQVCEQGHISSASALRAKVARNLVDVSIVLNQTVSPSNVQTNGTKAKRGEGIGNNKTDLDLIESIKSLLHDARELVRQVGQVCKEAVGDEQVDEAQTSNSSHDNAIVFPRRLRECCKVAFNILLLVGVAVSSFTPVLMRGMRKMKKKSKAGADGSSNQQLKTGATAGFSIECFEAARNIVLMYRDEIMAATERIQEWVTAYIDDGVNWAKHIYEDEVAEQVAHLIPDKLYEPPVPLRNGSLHKTEENAGVDENVQCIVRTELSKGVVDSIRSSQSVSCSALLESLTTVTRRLHLAEL